MGISKHELHTVEQNELAELVKAIAHPARIAILQYMFKIDRCVCGDLIEEIGLAQSTISQHLKVLKNCGIIQGEIAGTRVCYCIETQKWSRLKMLLSEFLNQNLTEMDCC